MTSWKRRERALRDIKNGMDDAQLKQQYGLNPATIKMIREQQRKDGFGKPEVG